MKILIAASEVAPFIKFGGLGDVVGSLPKALGTVYVDADVVVPFYPSIKLANSRIYKSLELLVPFDNASYLVEVYKTKLPNSDVDVFLLKNNDLLNLDLASVLGETKVYAFFCKAVVELIKSKFNTYDIIHCNDWHTGLITHLLEEELGTERPKTLFTIHNLMYQGIGLPDLLQDVGITPGTHRLIDWDIQNGDVNLLLQGITSSDYVSTVSPSYAREILTPEFGHDFFEILNLRADRLTGIINGIDHTQFPRYYDIHTWQHVKSFNKLDLQKRLDLKTDKDVPLFCFISRLDANQKGIDILYEALSEMLKKGYQIVLLGTGDTYWQGLLANLAANPVYKGLMACTFKFDHTLALQMYSASDFILIPSKYEPCGLTQMIGMWYGTIPIARNVGGLKDAVKNGINGFLFDEYNEKSLLAAIEKAIKIYKNPASYHTVVTNCLKTDFSWEKSALDYKNLYLKMLES